MESLRNWARKLQSEALILYRASKDPETPWFVKAFIVLVIAYAFSPIDLIPDFIPVLGYLDDLILVPLGIYLGLKMIPSEVLEKYRRELDGTLEEKPKLGKVGALLVFFMWILLIILLISFAEKLSGE
jgi:uncharacterized membrane protein YkvA (DUF1232 family)